LSGPKLLVLDEATSALDAETERALSETLKDLSGSITTVIVAHRLALVRDCDLILYIESGRVQASGNFNDLRRTSKGFAEQARLLGL